MHIPVLLQEVLYYLDPKSGDHFIDATFGMGGHTDQILEKTKPDGKVLAIEIDRQLVETSEVQEKLKRYGDRLILVNDSFTHLESVVMSHGFHNPKGILLDLGMSSWHVDESGKGFSFQKDEKLRMSYRSGESMSTARELVNALPESELRELFFRYGEERFSRRIARHIVEIRERKEIDTSGELSDIILESLPFRYRRSRIHPSTRVFQALRIAVNHELENITSVLPQAVRILPHKGRLVVISFHSLEDRIVKHFFREERKLERLAILTKKPVVPGREEGDINPRSRSAKLRVAEKR